jgi:3-dehydroquinate synthase
LSYAEIIELPSGEENKQLDICMQVWETFTDYQIDRNAIVINLGGGVISDMGGLIASLYKRGIKFINIPTSLLAMVDASVGGKTGVDLGGYKNQIGLFSFPKSVFVDPCFLTTLSLDHLKNGYAEMFKHGLIFDKDHWKELKDNFVSIEPINVELIKKSIFIKNTIVLIDPFEKNERKKLNFGHTIGHAIESLFLQNNKPIFHGFAVIAGIIIESFISFRMELICENEFLEIKEFLIVNYPKIKFDINQIDEILFLMKQDKKNNQNQIKMVLLQSIGSSIVDIAVDSELIEEGLKMYLDY